MTTKEQAPEVADPVIDSSASDTDGLPISGAETGSADEADDPEIDPEYRRVGPVVGEEMFGAQYVSQRFRVWASGPAQYGNDNTMNNYYGPRPPEPIIGVLGQMDELLRTYVPVDADDGLDQALASRSTSCLTGPINSGRFTTACAALTRRYGPDRIREVLLPPGASAEALVGLKDQIFAGHGFILRWPGTAHIETMRNLAGLFHERLASLLLVVNEGTWERETHRAEIRHRHPDPVAVFAAHLEQHLHRSRHLPAGQAGQLVERYRENKELRSELEQTYGPREAVVIARSIGAKDHPLTENDMNSVLAETQPRRRRRAARILLPEKNTAPARGRDRQHERAFRIAYAVFRRRPLHYVFESAAWLLAEIDNAAMRSDWGSLALEHPVRELLGSELEGDWSEGQDAANSSSGSSRSAWIRDAGLRGAILEVAWHDFDNTREPLLKWLNRLVNDGDQTMNRAAAETAALLAHHDFDRIHGKLVDEWAASPRPHLRQAAAWTETVAALGGHVGNRIRQKIRIWCLGSSNYQRDTAARIYASGLQQPVLAWSMADLRRIAADRMQRKRRSVAQGINQLYAPDRAAWITTELAHWADEPLVRVHAARAMVVLSARSVDPGDSRPEMLQRLLVGDVDFVNVAKIWRVALHDPDVADIAWPALARWLSLADFDDMLRPIMTDLLLQAASGSRDRRRALFYLEREWPFDDGVPLWIRNSLIEN